MSELLTPLLEDYLGVTVFAFMLIISRITGLLLFSPVFPSRALPALFRFYIAFPIALMLIGVVPAPVVQPVTVIDLVLYIFGELLVGLLIGGFLQLVLQGLQLAGQTAGQQLGLALANVINPQLDEQISTTAVLYVTVATLIFFAIGAHREMFAALINTFFQIPLGQVFFNHLILDNILSLLSSSMMFAVRVAAPVTVALLLTEIALGLIGRTVPQMNILSVGFGLRLTIGLLVTMISMEAAMSLVPEYLEDAFKWSEETLLMMVPE